ncbi:sporulation protein [Marinactinospora thermotolerans]|uniref:sporulation protein n=1 Tax=Marinactinospora thermotolerans TaxID=531310 RepID=UPI003D935F40
MVFKRVLSMFGVGGSTVDTVLANPEVRPGTFLEGHVELAGGEVDVDIEEIVLALVSRVELDGHDAEVGAEFARIPVAGSFRLAAGERHSIPFRFPIPWQTPLTEAGGGSLPGMVLGLRTDVVVDRAADKGDLDRVLVHPLPVQDRVLEALHRLGFVLKGADVEAGHLAGTAQEFPFFQEIEFHPSPRYAHEVNEVEVSFVADPHGMDVIIEFDRRGGMFTEGQDLYGRFRVEHAEAGYDDWTAKVDSWVAGALERHRALFGGHGHYGYEGGHYGYEGGHPGYHGHDDHGGSGLGTAAAVGLGVAGGVVAGMVAAEVVDEIGDFFEGEEDEGDEE